MFMFKAFQKRLLKNKKGFTLVELMIVVAIIGILAIVLIPQAAKMRENAKLSGVESNMRMVQAQVEGIIDNCGTAAELSTALIARLGDSISNPFDVASKNVEELNDTNAFGSGAEIAAVAIKKLTTSENKEAADALFASDGGSSIVKEKQHLTGAVVVAITGNGPTLQAHIYGYDADGSPRTVKASVKSVSK